MLTNNSDKDWEHLGKIDAYHAVATKEQYRKGNLNADTFSEFFESGRRQCDTVFEIVEQHLAAGFRPMRTLEFGCGVGRMLIPLAERCPHVVGVDVSESMLVEAKRKCEERGITNVELVRGDDELRGVSGDFDFIHSHVVLQHIPTKRGERITARLVELLRPGGVAVLHFAYATEKSRLRRSIPWMRKSVPAVHGVLNLLEGKAFGYPLMQSNRYNLNTIFRLLQAKGCDHSYVRFTSYPANYGVILFFQKTALPSL
ncbi:MAG: class I SAM-dependent methyltransferase [Gammaproteobacteria bacterium]